VVAVVGTVRLDKTSIFFEVIQGEHQGILGGVFRLNG